MENTQVIDQSRDYGDEENQMIEEMLQDPDAVQLGTYYSYKAEVHGQRAGLGDRAGLFRGAILRKRAGKVPDAGLGGKTNHSSLRQLR
jgi:hypothetical protein